MTDPARLETIPERFYREQRERLCLHFGDGNVEELESVMRDVMPHLSMGQQSTVLAMLCSAWGAGVTHEKQRRERLERSGVVKGGIDDHLTDGHPHLSTVHHEGPWTQHDGYAPHRHTPDGKTLWRGNLSERVPGGD